MAILIGRLNASYSYKMRRKKDFPNCSPFLRIKNKFERPLDFTPHQQRGNNIDYDLYQ